MVVFFSGLALTVEAMQHIRVLRLSRPGGKKQSTEEGSGHIKRLADQRELEKCLSTNCVHGTNVTNSGCSMRKERSRIQIDNIAQKSRNNSFRVCSIAWNQQIELIIFYMAWSWHQSCEQWVQPPEREIKHPDPMAPMSRTVLQHAEGEIANLN